MKDPRRTRLARPSSTGLAARKEQAGRAAGTQKKLRELAERAQRAAEQGPPPPQEEKCGYDRFPLCAWLQDRLEDGGYAAAEGLLRHITHAGVKSKFNAVAGIYQAACDREDIPETVRLDTQRLCFEFFWQCGKDNNGPDFVMGSLYTARCYARGHGCAQDADKAGEWLGKVRKLGGRLGLELGGDHIARRTILGLQEEIKQAREAGKVPSSSPAAAQ